MFSWLKNLFAKKRPVPAVVNRPPPYGGKPVVGDLDDTVWIRTAWEEGRLDKPNLYPTSMSETEQPGWTPMSRREYLDIKAKLKFGRTE